MEGVASSINTPHLNPRPASPSVRTAGDRHSPVSTQQTPSTHSADTSHHIPVEQARDNSDSLPSDPPRASRMLNAQAHIAANVTGEVRAKEADGENKRLQDQQIETNEDGTPRKTTLFEEIDGKKYKIVNRYNYRNGEKSSVSTERYQVGEDGADMLSERKTVNYILGTSDGQERVHSEIVQKFDGSEDNPLETRNTQFNNNGSVSSEKIEDHTKGSVFETWYEQGSPSTRGNVRGASITKRNPDGSNLEISYHGGSGRPRVTVKGEGSLTRDEFNRAFGSLPGANKLTEYSSGRTVNVSSTPEGSAVFNVKGSAGSEKTLTVNNSFSQDAGVTFEDKFTHDQNVTINRDVHFNDGHHLTSRDSYRNNVLSSSNQKLTYANGEIQERNFFRSVEGGTGYEDIVNKDRYGNVKDGRAIQHNYNENTRTERIWEGTARNTKEVNEYSSSTGKGPQDIKVSERYINGLPSQEKEVFVDANLDGNFTYNERVDRYTYNTTYLNRSDLNNTTILARNKYYDNVADYLGGPRDRIKHYVERRGNNVVSTFSPTGRNSDRNIEISYGYTNAPRGDVRNNPNGHLSERPDFITVKAVRGSGGHTTTIEKTAFPGTTQNHITSVTEKRWGWEKNTTHTHLMDRNNKQQVNRQVTEASSDEANKYQLEGRAREIGIEKMPPAFQEFMDKTGHGNLSVHMKEDKDLQTGEVRRSMTVVNPETGDRFVLQEEEGKQVSYFKDGKTGEELLDMGDAAIRKNADEILTYKKDAHGGMQLVNKDTIDNVTGYTKTGSKAIRKAGQEALGLFEVLGKASRTANAGYRAGRGSSSPITNNIADFLNRNGVSGNFLRHADKLNVALGGVVTTCTVMDMMDKSSINGGDVATLVGDFADLGADVSRLNAVKNLAARSASHSAGAVSGGGGLSKGLKLTGKTLGVIGVGASLVSAGYNIANEDYMGAGLDVLAGMGTTIGLIAKSTGWAGPVGWIIAGVGISGSLIYYQTKKDEIHPLGESPLEKEYFMKNLLPRL